MVSVLPACALPAPSAAASVTSTAVVNRLMSATSGLHLCRAPAGAVRPPALRAGRWVLVNRFDAWVS